LNVAPKIAFDPATNFSATPIDVKITATDSTDPSPKVYYTTDGSTPTTSSPSFVSTKTINITATTTFNVLAIDNEGNQSTSSQKYTVGDVPTITMYFKPPTTPTGSWVGAIPKIHAWKVVNGVTTNITGAWPGIAMTSAGNGWFKYTVQNETNINVIFNNGQNGIGTNQTGNLEGITSDKWYDWDKKDFVLSVEDDNVSGTEFSISPNPTTGKITIKSIEELDVFGVYNLNGELIKNGKIIDNQIDISTLPSNIYYIKCLNKAEKVYLKKIIKK